MEHIDDTMYAEDCLASGQLFDVNDAYVSPYIDCQEHITEMENILKATNAQDLLRAARQFQLAQIQYLLKLRGWK